MTSQETFEKLLETNEESYNYTKLIEELFELGELLSKKINKNGTEHEPPLEKIIEEMGDVQLRSAILSRKLNITQDILERINSKLEKYGGYITENKYIGRI